MKNLLRLLAHLVFGIRKYNDKCLKNFGENISGKSILELGSGKHEYGKDYYSAKRYFDSSNQFVQSDINQAYGHKVVDVTRMNDSEAYDIILCMNVLEHVYDYQLAINNMYRALKPEGQLAVFVPMFYPLHDEPHDYWRFTRHAIQKMFKEYSSVNISHKGLNQFPVAYFVIVTK